MVQIVKTIALVYWIQNVILNIDIVLVMGQMKMVAKVK
jgi:hypothetical protein